MSKTITLRLPSLKRVSKKVSIILGLATALVIYLFWHDIYVYARYRDEGERAVQTIVHKIKKNVVLPSETPGLATITDKTKVSRGGVLEDAENGDKILLYYKASKALLYRPSLNKVVAIGPLVLDASAAQVKDTRIVVRNGSGNKAKFDDIFTALKDRYSEAQITDQSSSSRNDFPKTIIIDLTEGGKKAEFTGAIAELIDGQRGILPNGESKPDADILIIVGQN